ncbi:hypothetical protein IWQ49_000047 [Labrenzia sp. EL_126]|nr:hypothetical protein [Labrenzia sp. EL_126]
MFYLTKLTTEDIENLLKKQKRKDKAINKRVIVDTLESNYSLFFSITGINRNQQQASNDVVGEIGTDRRDVIDIIKFVTEQVDSSEVERVDVFSSEKNKVRIIDANGEYTDLPIFTPGAFKQLSKEGSEINVSDFFYEFRRKFPILHSKYKASLIQKKLKAINEPHVTSDNAENEKLDYLTQYILALDQKVTIIQEGTYLQELLRSSEEHVAKITKQQISSLSNASALYLKNCKADFFSTIDETVTQIAQQLEDQANTMLDAKKRELVETVILEDAMELWEGKAKKHNKYFAIGAGVFMTAVLVPIIYIFTHLVTTVNAIEVLTPEGKAFQISNLVVVTIPVLGYAWILRLISRFTLQNMMLSDDASQRSVMAKTFIRLVGHGQADENHDRAIMLNALFRPLPGAGEPDIQPPNLTDFLKGKT